MPAPAALALYIPVALVMAFTPGPATLFVLSRASVLGPRAGFLSAAGLLTGTVGLVALAALGLTGILAAAPLFFDVIKMAGTAYLVYLGLRTVASNPRSGAGGAAARSASEPNAGRRKYFRLYRDGVVTELFNPKAALFYASVLPQFVDARRPDVPLQMFALGAIFVVFGGVSLGLIAIFAGTLQARLRQSGAWQAATRWISGGVLVALGLRLAVGRAR
ncbi:MAG TPA: LysE family translocator [bacterium]|nr:LysE family translocator [bacterium]